MRIPPRDEDEGLLPYPFETIRYWYVAPFGGRSESLAEDEVGVNAEALARNTELEPNDRVSLGIVGTNPKTRRAFQETYEVVAIPAGSREAAELSPRGEFVLSDRPFSYVLRPHLQPRLGDALVMKGTVARLLAESQAKIEELLRGPDRRPEGRGEQA